MHRYLFYILFLAITVSGCQSLDDDSDYANETYASFVKVTNLDGSKSLLRYSNPVIDLNWNTNAGIANHDLGDATMVENKVWLSNTNSKEIVVVSPSSAKIIERYDNLPIVPHFLAVGEKQVFVSDTIAQKVAFVKRRNGKVQTLEIEGKSGQCIYNAGTFFFQSGDQSVGILNEQAMTLQATIDIGKSIDVLQFDRYKSVIVSAHDSSKFYQALVSYTRESETKTPFVVNYSKVCATPYFAAKYGTEYLLSLYLKQSRIETASSVLIEPNVDDFEVDFFEGTILFKRNDSLHIKSITTGIEEAQFPFSGTMNGAFHQYAKE